ncbi:MAG: hypothetical protein ACKO8Q_09550 [Bacteroidota bacterium]
MRLLSIFFLFGISSLIHAQFRCANISFFLPTENPSLIVSPLDYNKISTYAGTGRTVGIQGQINLNSIYSAIGISSNYLTENSFTSGIQFATHSFLTKNIWHTGAGVQLEWLHNEANLNPRIKNEMAWSLGCHVMSNPAGRFLLGINYKNKDLIILPFERNVVIMNQILSCQMGSAFAINRKLNVSVLTLFKRAKIQEEIQNCYQITGNVNLTNWTIGLGWKNWGVGKGMLTRFGVYYRNWLLAYVTTNSNFTFTNESFIHEISISKKF